MWSSFSRLLCARLRAKLTAVLALSLALTLIVVSVMKFNDASRFPLPSVRLLEYIVPAAIAKFDNAVALRAANGEVDAPYLFPVDTSTNVSDVVSRSVDMLKVMTKYGELNLTSNRTVKIILRVGNFNWEDWLEGNERFVQNKCPVKECWLTSDYKNQRLTADALLISEVNSESLKAYLPKPHNQIWIARQLESPHHNRIDPSSLKGGLVNWTITYRFSSTAPAYYYPQFLPTGKFPPQYQIRDNPYFMRIPEPPGASYSTINFALGKSKKVAWFASNCGAPNGRGSYVEQLAKHIQVDIYGGCGKHSCVKENNGCRKMLSQEYKFYLAFENSNCVEYISEKPGFQALLSDVIPIVMGARPEDYEALLPPGSYIHVDDFKSPKYLAEYLKILDKNDTLYNSYFRWKDNWTAVDDTGYCRLCFLLHYRDDVKYVNSYTDYTDWWNGACNAEMSDQGSWRTWRPAGFWTAKNATAVHRPPSV